MSGRNFSSLTYMVLHPDVCIVGLDKWISTSRWNKGKKRLKDKFSLFPVYSLFTRILRSCKLRRNMGFLILDLLSTWPQKSAIDPDQIWLGPKRRSLPFACIPPPHPTNTYATKLLHYFFKNPLQIYLILELFDMDF